MSNDLKIKSVSINTTLADKYVKHYLIFIFIFYIYYYMAAQTLSLEQRYNTQKVGGAYDAKKAGTSTETSAQAATVANTGDFVVRQQMGISNFKGVSGTSYKEVSIGAAGLDTTKYQG